MGRGRWGAFVLGVALVFALVIAACGGDDDGASDASAPETQGAATGSTGRTGAPAVAGNASTATGPASSGSTAPLVPGDDVVYTGSVDVRVSEVDAATRNAQQKVTTAGGYLFSQRSSITGGAPSATLVFKVPPGQFLSTIDALGSLGTEVARNVQAVDVSAQVVDLEARLASARLSLTRTREFLSRATNIADVIALEAELTKRETIVEQIQGQLNVVRSQVAAATITLTVGEKLKDTKPTPSDNIPGVFDGLRAGAVAFYNTLRVVLLVLFVLAPWVPAIVLIWYVARRVNRWLTPRREARDARLTAAAAPLFVPFRPVPRHQPPPPRTPAAPGAPPETVAAPEPATASATGAEIADPPKSELPVDEHAEEKPTD